MPETLTCPSCGAPLNYEPGKLTLSCDYCHNNIIVPEALRPQNTFAPTEASFLRGDEFATLQEIARLAQTGQKIEAIKLFRHTFGTGLKESKEAVEAIAAGRPVSMMHTNSGTPVGTTTIATSATPQTGRLSTGCIWLIILAIAASIILPLGLTFGGMAFFTDKLFGLVQEQAAQATMTTTLATHTPAPTPSPTPGFAQIAQIIGSDGTGPLHFTDARSIAVDGAGNIYVGEYLGNRIQKLSPDGQFLTQWTANDEYPLRDLAADRRGVVYAVHTGQIWRYDGSTGQPLTPPAYTGPDWLDSVTVAPDGTLLALQPGSGQGDTLLRFDAAGQVTQVIDRPINRGAARPESTIEKIAVDGPGRIYLLGRNQDAVYKLSPAGEFMDRFGDSGTGPGQFSSPTDIAIDGQGRVYVADTSKGVIVFSPEGTFLAEIPVEGTGAVSSLVFNDRDELFVVTHNRVIKFILTELQTK